MAMNCGERGDGRDAEQGSGCMRCEWQCGNGGRTRKGLAREPSSKDGVGDWKVEVQAPEPRMLPAEITCRGYCPLAQP